MPRVAALLDIQPLSDISDVIDADLLFARSSRQRAATVKSSDAKKIITVRAPASTLPRPKAAPPASRVLPPSPPVTFQIHLSELSKSERPELTLPNHRLRRPRHAERREFHQAARPMPASWVLPSAHRAPRSMPVTSRTIIRSARPAKIVGAGTLHRGRHLGCISISPA